MRTSRVYAAGPLAAVMTGALFYTMQGLVGGEGDIELDPENQPRIIDYVQGIDEPEVIKNDWTVEEPEVIEPPKQDPLPPVDWENSNGDRIGGGFESPSPHEPTPELPRFGQADGDYLPLVVVQPAYPNRAQGRGIEGYVVVELTVAADGSVPAGSIRIVTAEPKGYFERAAKKAATKFKYKPKIVDGVARPVHGVRYQFSFNLGE